MDTRKLSRIKSFFPKIRLEKRRARALAVSALVGAGLYNVLTVVNPNQMAMRETLFNVTSDRLMGPGWYFQIPFVQYTHVYNMNTQRFDFSAGSNRWMLPISSSTSDQNILQADVTLNYKVLPDEQKLIYHRWDMHNWPWQGYFGKPDGYYQLTGLLNDSANAVLGRRRMGETLSNPKKFAEDLYQDFTQRLQMNNVPVEVESLEVKGFNTSFIPSRTKSYNAVGTRVPSTTPLSPQ